jgi:hypothetical protein
MKSGPQLLLAALIIALGGCAALMPRPPAERDATVRLDRGLTAYDAVRYQEAREELTWVYRHCPGRQAGSQALAALAALELDPRNRDARPAVGTELLGRLIQDPAVPQWSRPLVETGFLVSLALGAPHPDHHPSTEPIATDPDPGAEPAETPPDTAAADAPAGEEPAEEPAGEPVPVDSGAAAPAPAAPVAVAVAPEPLDPAAVQDVYGCGPVVEVEGWYAPALPELPGPSMAVMLSEMQSERDSIAMTADTLRQELAAAREQLAATREELERIRRTLKP